MAVDEPVPVARAAVGCLFLALVGFGIALLVRPLIFTVAPPRGDTAVVVATAAEVRASPVSRDVILSRSYGWDGERDAGDGRVQLRLIVASTRFEGVAVLNGSSPVASGCAVEIGADRLVDCEGRAWTFEGAPIDSADPRLQRFPAENEGGNVVADLTRTATE
jgi:hypothetical protein